MKKVQYLVQAALIATLYAVAAILQGPTSSAPIQVRISEALTILPFFTPAAIPGLFVGCIVANFAISGQPADIVFGSIATLLAALITNKMPKRLLAPLPPVVVNAIIVGFVLNYLYKVPLLLTMGSVAAGQTAACYCLGYPLLRLLERYRNVIFRQASSSANFLNKQREVKKR
jgi:uncharacterized membrane protein